ncbi:alpha-glucuronidase family glycosyl hydrolase [Halalkalibacter akibai]|uniref:Xylan alpha-1,2-glucuronidase n=1 Tax=Halalkalibacter akibai (strain ATCC 43226 / DSM 21942 / CIP 109018 / JCM 9157 / 1139) TaxID=1236973 RepID=W4QPJ2_HALA3|nr:alpha-glucuronidase family glycosyl hydrolase [Halalkalibacter akibai]GAE33976.1 alpha-glucosidase [Halalkalibacter akibai JCM 9157]
MTIENKLNTQKITSEESYACWLQYRKITDPTLVEKLTSSLSNLIVLDQSERLTAAIDELTTAIQSMLEVKPVTLTELGEENGVVLATEESLKLNNIELEYDVSELTVEGYVIKSAHNNIYLIGKTDKGVLYAAFHLLRLVQGNEPLTNLNIIEQPKNRLRMINQWDNMDGSIERGYAGKSIFFEENKITSNLARIKDYARLLSSVGINSVSINNVNVFEVPTRLITEEFLPEVKNVADIFRSYGITTFLSINYASPIQIGHLHTADPLAPEVQEFWKDVANEIYKYVPDFGGFIVKADSEHRPGPFTYDRDHAEGANVLAKALKPHGGIVIWRCFVYNCLQDWRDRTTDRARAAYDNFKPLDGKFLDNVILQVKNGPMDFQVREAVSPLLGAMPNTNQVLEFQVTQEYTGQQKDLCYLVPLWKEVFDFDTHARGEGTTIKKITEGSVFDYSHSGVAAVSNIGNDENWTGNTLAQANFYGYGRLIWNPDLSAEEIALEWIEATFGNDPKVVETVSKMLLQSWEIYENYTTPLGIGWMVNPNHHYGVNVDGYEYSVWGTYHFADLNGLGVDRTVATGTGYTNQYFSPNSEMYESLETCPDDLLLFFHHVPYTHQLKTGKTVIQHFYNTHFEGVEQVEGLIESWIKLEGKIDKIRFANVLERLQLQLINAKEWRDQFNTYFFRKSGIADEKNRKIY